MWQGPDGVGRGGPGPSRQPTHLPSREPILLATPSPLHSSLPPRPSWVLRLVHAVVLQNVLIFLPPGKC